MFKNLLMVAVLVFGLTGCSLLPRITFDRPGVTPQTTEKTRNIQKCAGTLTITADGQVSCSKGYTNDEQSYKQKERRFTIQERIANFIRNLTGIWFIVFVALLIFCPGAIGWVLSTLFGAARRLRDALTSTIRGIQTAKKNGVNLSPEDKAKYDVAMASVMQELEKAHSDDPEVVKLIDKFRTDLKIKEQL